MKNFLLTTLLIAFTLSAFSQNLYKIDLKNTDDAEMLIDAKNTAVHYYNNLFCIASGDVSKKFTHKFITSEAWKSNRDYYLVWLPTINTNNYIDYLKQSVKVIYTDELIAIAEATTEEIETINAAIHGGLVKIQKSPVRKPQTHRWVYSKTNPAPEISDMVSQVVADSIIDDIQHMEDYGTRVYNTPEATEAQNWIKAQFERYGLNTELTYGGVDGSQNVIATQTGAVYPNKFVVVGGHFDSTSSDAEAPGADDNASGTAGVIEIARILSQMQFNYSIVYCAWTAEEIGLVGSGQWAEDAATANTEIIGYLNLDMIGYLQEGGEFHTDMMAPTSAQPLIELYETVVDLYIDDFIVYEGTMIGGDSDHTSFNNNGYMGIFPFEDSNDYSPHIHSSNDLIGPSVNNPELAKKFTQAGVAFMATAAELFNGLYPPMDLTLEQTEGAIELNWSAPLAGAENFEAYHIYRNDVELTTITNIDDNYFTDETGINGETYSYKVTASYTGDPGGESNASNTVTVTIGLMDIHFWDFEDGLQSWTISDNINGWRHGVQVDISGNNTNYLSTDSDDAGSGTHVEDYAISPQLNLSNYTVAFLEFDYGYRDYSSDEYKVMYRTATNNDWIEIENLAGTSGFTQHTIELPQEALTGTTQLAFYYNDNNSWAWYTAVDNVKIVAAQSGDQLDTPQNLTGASAEDHIMLQWEAVGSYSFEAYNIYRDGTQIGSIADIDINEYADSDNLTAHQTYTYYVTAQYMEQGESEPSNEVSVTYEPIGLNETANSTYNFYPNPISEGTDIHYSGHATMEWAAAYDLTGKKVSELNIDTNNKTIQTADLPTGTYLLKINTKEGTKTEKIMIIE
ncbi:MAG: M28 family peptidase [Salinivirgaceae bacterium]